LAKPKLIKAYKAAKESFAVLKEKEKRLISSLLKKQRVSGFLLFRGTVKESQTTFNFFTKYGKGTMPAYTKGIIARMWKQSDTSISPKLLLRQLE